MQSPINTAAAARFFPEVVASISTHVTTTVTTATQASRALLHSAEAVNEMYTKAMGSMDMKELVKLIRVIEKNASWSEEYLRLMGTFAEHEDAKRLELMRIGACDGLIRIMKKWRTTKRITVQGCRAVAFLSRSEAVGETLGKLGCSHTLLSTLSSFATSDRDVARWGCWAVSNLACSDLNQVELGKLGACTRIIEVMQQWKTETQVVNECLWAILNLSTRNKMNTSSLGENHACSTICEILALYRSNKEMVTKACEVIVNLAINTDNQHKFGNAGACQLICLLLAEYREDARIVQVCCWAMSNLSPSPTNQNLFSQGQACEMIVDSLRRYRSNPQVLERACTAVINLTHIPVNEEKLINLGCGELLLSILREYMGRDADVTLNACICVLNLLFKEQGKRRVIQAGGQDILLKMIQCHQRDSPDIVKYGIRSLRNLMSFEEAASGPHVGQGQQQMSQNQLVLAKTWSKQSIRSSSDISLGCTVLMESLAHWQADHAIVFYGTKTLLLWMEGPAGGAKVEIQNLSPLAGCEDFCQTLADLLQTWMNDKVVAAQILRVIQAFSENNANNRLNFARTPACERVLKLLARAQPHEHGSQDLAHACFTSGYALAKHNILNRSTFARLDACKKTASAIEVLWGGLPAAQRDASPGVHDGCSFLFYLCQSPAQATQLYPYVAKLPRFRWLSVMLTLVSGIRVKRLGRKSGSFKKMPIELIMMIARTLPCVFLEPAVLAPSAAIAV